MKASRLEGGADRLSGVLPTGSGESPSPLLRRRADRGRASTHRAPAPRPSRASPPPGGRRATRWRFADPRSVGGSTPPRSDRPRSGSRLTARLAWARASSGRSICRAASASEARMKASSGRSRASRRVVEGLLGLIDPEQGEAPMETRDRIVGERGLVVDLDRLIQSARTLEGEAEGAVEPQLDRRPRPPGPRSGAGPRPLPARVARPRWVRDRDRPQRRFRGRAGSPEGAPRGDRRATAPTAVGRWPWRCPPVPR